MIDICDHISKKKISLILSKSNKRSEFKILNETFFFHLYNFLFLVLLTKYI